MSDTSSGLTVELPAWGGLPDDPEGGSASLAHPALTILYHPDLRRAGERVLLNELAAGQPVQLSRLEPGFAPPGQPTRAPWETAT